MFRKGSNPMIMVQTSRGLRPLSKTALLTFLLMACLVLALAAISIGFLLQLAASASPYLISFGFALLEGAGIIFLAYRLALLSVRSVRFLIRRHQSRFQQFQCWLISQVRASIRFLFFLLFR